MTETGLPPDTDLFAIPAGATHVPPAGIPGFIEAITKGQMPQGPVVVEGSLDLRHVTLPHGLPNDMLVLGDLDCAGVHLPMFPKNLRVDGGADFTGCHLTEIHPVCVRQGLGLRGNDRLKRLPKGHVGGNLVIHGTSIQKVPKAFKVAGMIYMDDPGTLTGRPRRGGLFSGLDGYAGRFFFAGEVRRGKSIIANLARTAFKRRAYRHEDFETAMRRFGLEDQDLPGVHTRLVFQAYSLICCMVFALLYGVNQVVGILQGDSRTSTILALIVALAIATLFSVLALRASLRSWQVRCRRLGGALEFLRAPMEWLPPLSMSIKTTDKSDKSQT